jgi:phosphoribosylformylglycinamidine cyclo-ligase
MNYKDSGVDIEAGNEFVERLKKKAPYIGGFNGMIKVPVGYEEPVLVSGADGVGTKINMASISGDWSTIGIDLVAMCVNDIITCGAKPLYFLDYISTKKIDGRLDKIMDGIVKGCEIAAIDLLGGETAEHGRFANDIDLAGFCTGIVEKGEMLDGRMIKPGDKIIGFASSGLHSNGYSLINDMLWRHKIFYADYPELLTPTTIYSPMIQQLLDEVPILGMAHITGGGLVENVPRCLPKGLKANINYDSWPLPKIFSDIMLAGEIPEEEMKRVFNLGIGFCIIIPPDIDIHTTIPSWVIGEVYE